MYYMVILPYFSKVNLSFYWLIYYGKRKHELLL